MNKKAIAKKMEKLNETLGISQLDDVLFSQFNDYHYSLNLINNNGVLMYLMSIVVDKTLSSEAIKKLKKETKTIVNFRKFKDLIVLEVTFGLPLKEEKKKLFFDNVINKVVMVLQSENINNNTACAFCNLDNENDIEWNIYKGLYLPMHHDCLKNQYQLQQTLIDEENKNLSKLPISIVFSLLGAIIGIIPAYIIVFLTDTLFAIAFALSPICAFLGYKIGKAPLRNYTTIIVVAETLIVGILSVIGYYAIVLSILDLPFSAIQEFSNDILISMVQVVLFVIIGIWISWGYIRKTNQSKVEK